MTGATTPLQTTDTVSDPMVITMESHTCDGVLGVGHDVTVSGTAGTFTDSLTFTITPTTGCPCNEVSVTTSGGPIEVIMYYDGTSTPTSSVFSETVTGFSCTSFTYATTDARLGYSDTALTATTTITAPATNSGYAAQDGDTLSVTVTVNCPDCKTTSVSDTFVITWKHECWNAAITAPTSADSLALSTSRLGTAVSFQYSGTTDDSTTGGTCGPYYYEIIYN